MKKLIGIIFLILAIALVIVYLFLPSSGKLVVNGNIKSSNDGLYRSMINQQLWTKWFSNDIVITKPLLNSAETEIIVGNQKAIGSILLVPGTNDSTKLYWQAELPNYNRFTGYPALKNLQHQITVALDSLKAFSENTKNVYGIDIKETSTKDTFLITKRFSTSSYPTLPEIYSHINELKKDTAAYDVKQVGYPMLNITPSDSSWNCMVALPIDKKLNSPSFVRMVPGRFMVTEISGGPHTINNAYKTMQQYFTDYKRTSIAIPFEYIVTDRLNEPDTTRWITYIYFPVY